MGYSVKASTTSTNKVSQIARLKADPFIVDIENISSNIQSFLKSEILIINITSKSIEGFQSLLQEIEKSDIENVLLVSSTSVYENQNKIISESDDSELSNTPLVIIENLFRNSSKVATTIVRFAGLIGNNRHPGRFFSRGNIVKDPDSFVNLIHLDDCIAIISQILQQQIWNEVFNCCADTHPTKRDYYTKAAKSIRVVTPVFATSDSKSFKIISNEKVKRHLNYFFLHADLMGDINHL